MVGGYVEYQVDLVEVGGGRDCVGKGHQAN